MSKKRKRLPQKRDSFDDVPVPKPKVGYVMGTDFDSFERCAGEVGEADALQSGRLTEQQVNNRKILRSIMLRAGWVPLSSEWWHFNAYTRAYTKEHYSLFPL